MSNDDKPVFGITPQNREMMAVAYIKVLLNHKEDINNLEEACLLLKERFEMYDLEFDNVIMGLTRMANNVKGNIKMMKV